MFIINSITNPGIIASNFPSGENTKPIKTEALPKVNTTVIKKRFYSVAEVLMVKVPFLT